MRCGVTLRTGTAGTGWTTTESRARTASCRSGRAWKRDGSSRARQPVDRGGCGTEPHPGAAVELRAAPAILPIRGPVPASGAPGRDLGLPPAVGSRRPDPPGDPCLEPGPPAAGHPAVRPAGGEPCASSCRPASSTTSHPGRRRWERPACGGCPCTRQRRIGETGDSAWARQRADVAAQGRGQCNSQPGRICRRPVRGNLLVQNDHQAGLRATFPPAAGFPRAGRSPATVPLRRWRRTGPAAG